MIRLPSQDGELRQHQTITTDGANASTVDNPLPAQSNELKDNSAAQVVQQKQQQIQQLKRNLVENVAMIRKMFSIEQELRQELDDAESENGTLAVENRRLIEEQVRLRVLMYVSYKTCFHFCELLLISLMGRKDCENGFLYWNQSSSLAQHP